MDTTQAVNHISLCAGYGGIDLGLSRVFKNMRTIAFVEIEAFCILNLVKKIEAGFLSLCPIYTDAKTFPYRSFYKRVDILSGGFPCQPFSTAGKRTADDDPKHLFPFIIKGIRESRPALVFLENVEGIISAKLKGNEWADSAGTPVLCHVLRELERAGYKAAWGIFSAVECGATHQRKRVFILAMDYTSCSVEQVNRALVHKVRQAVEGGRASIQSKRKGELSLQDFDFALTNTAYPAGRGAGQYEWEPPRVVAHTNSCRGRIDLRPPICESATGFVQRSDVEANRKGLIKPPMGRGSNGSAHRLDSTQLYTSSDNRTDELRMLGNGVVPDTAQKAFITLWQELTHK